MLERRHDRPIALTHISVYVGVTNRIDHVEKRSLVKMRSWSRSLNQIFI